MSLTSDQVCAIIRACGEAGVVRLSFDGLRLSFGRSANEPRTDLPLEVTPGPSDPYLPVEALTASEHLKIEKDTLESDELDVKERQVEELLLTDPLAAEELIIKGELTSNGLEPENED